MDVRPNLSEVSSGSGLVPSQSTTGSRWTAPASSPASRSPAHGSGPAASGSTRTEVSASARSLRTRTSENASTSSIRTPGRWGTISRHSRCRAQILVRRGDDPEVLRLLVGEHDEPSRPSRPGGGQVVDGVLPTLLARQHDAGRRGRIVGRYGQPFGGVGAVQGDEDEGPVPGAPGAEREPAVILFEDQDVIGRVGPEFVAPQLVRAHGLIEPDVEDDGRTRSTRPARTRCRAPSRGRGPPVPPASSDRKRSS